VPPMNEPSRLTSRGLIGSTPRFTEKVNVHHFPVTAGSARRPGSSFTDRRMPASEVESILGMPSSEAESRP
jgi:hypothetical protein